MYPEGTIVAGKYQVERTLGEGGMGIVVAARHVELGSRVALKFLRADMAQHPSVVERFMREARASAQLQSEHVCRVTDVGRLDDGVPYIVMELLHGHDLAQILKAEGQLAATTVAEYVLQASQGIAEAHAVGIVHRDLKPGNLFVSLRPNGKPLVKVLDFGVAKAPTAAQDFSLTQTASVMGSPGYMSPEQLKSSKVVDARADIWSLGVVMYELTCGRKPFVAQSITELAVRVVTEPHPPLPSMLPRGFVDIVGRCLEKDPARRFADVAQLAAALAPFAAGGHDSALGVSHALRGATGVDVPPSPPGPTTPTTLGSASGAVEGGRRRSSAALAAVIGGGIAIGIITVALVMGGGDDSRRGVRPASSAPDEASAIEPAPTAVAPPAAAPAPVENAVVPVDAAAAATTKPAATSEPVATKPAATKPATTEPATTEPVTTKPTTKPPATTEPVAAKPTTTKPVATTPEATTKPEITPGTPKRRPPSKKPPKPTVEDLSELRK